MLLFATLVNAWRVGVFVLELCIDRFKHPGGNSESMFFFNRQIFMPQSVFIPKSKNYLLTGKSAVLGSPCCSEVKPSGLRKTVIDTPCTPKSRWTVLLASPWVHHVSAS